jgi:hypothetical protein
MSEETIQNKTEKFFERLENCFKPQIEIQGSVTINGEDHRLENCYLYLDESVEQAEAFIAFGFSTDKTVLTKKGFLAFIPADLPLKLRVLKTIHDHKTTSAREIAERTGFSMGLVCSIFQGIDAAELEKTLLAD